MPPGDTHDLLLIGRSRLLTLSVGVGLGARKPVWAVALPANCGRRGTFSGEASSTGC